MKPVGTGKLSTSSLSSHTHDKQREESHHQPSAPGTRRDAGSALAEGIEKTQLNDTLSQFVV